MADPIPSRSSKGCLTCKRRKKKCDEKRPRCQRCLLGGFDCLGYAHLEGYSSQPTSNYRLAVSETATSNAISFPHLPDGTSHPSMGMAVLPGGTLLPFVNYPGTQTQYNEVSLPHPNKYSASIPRSPQLGPFERNSMVDLITSQYARVADRALFRPFPYVFKEVIAARAQRSDIILKTMYLGARICQALLDDTSEHIYFGWIDSFRRQISGTQSSVAESDVADLADRLSAHHELSFFAFMLVDSPIGYSLLRAGVPLFLQLAAKCPHVWSQDSAISISHALNPKRHEMARFVLADTISALAFGTAPLLNYDTTIHEDELECQLGGFLEQVYSCPVILLILLARVNSARVTRLTNQSGPTSSDVREVEDRVRNWSPTLDYADRPFEFITRLAVQECWRQATLIYAYMGMCGVNSADERVQRLVSQVAHLASTIEAGSPFEAHICVPCLIAGVATRKEKHRATFRRKILTSQRTDTRLLRGADFVFVLDHLWHGIAAGGNPVTWEDYVNSRYITMPVDV